jgi:hypothetical protein
MERVYVGLDPDTEKSGVAFYEPSSGKLELSNLPFFALFDYLSFVKKQETEEVKCIIIIEAGWLNKSNWHKVNNGSSSLNSKIGERTGANFEVGKKIVEMCEYLGFEYKLVKPTKTKLNHTTFAKITGIIGKTNQETRDAGMLVFGRK